MKPNRNQKIIFFVAIAALIALPLYFIMRSENMLSEKENIYRFRPTRLIDPGDVLRGDYLVIDFPRFVEYNGDGKAGRGAETYVVVERDSAGYAQFKYATDEKPATSNYFTTKIQGNRTRGERVWIDVPFEKYFLNEDNAKLAEKLYEIEIRDPETNMFIEVAIADGESLLKDIYVDSIPLNQFLNKLTPDERKEIEDNYDDGNFRPRRRRLR